MPDRARILTVLRRARDMCLRPLARSRPELAAARRPGEHITMPVIRGRILRVAMREGNPARQPLLLCNGFGASLEMLQPFVDALDPQRAIIRFDMPGLGGSPALVLLPARRNEIAPLIAGFALLETEWQGIPNCGYRRPQSTSPWSIGSGAGTASTRNG